MMTHTCSPDEIFVFGSNLKGLHGAGAALTARERYGAVYGVAEGLTGRSYALPTKDANLRTLPLQEILSHVRKFMAFAQSHPEMKFFVTAVGCGLAGLKPYQIGPMFVGSPPNCRLPPEFARERYLPSD